MPNPEVVNDRRKRTNNRRKAQKIIAYLQNDYGVSGLTNRMLAQSIESAGLVLVSIETKEFDDKLEVLANA